MTVFWRTLRSLLLCALTTLTGTLAVPTAALAFNCPGSEVKQSGLCYAKPRDGYSCQASSCVANCPDGYHSSGALTCHFSGTTTYTQRPYTTRSHSNMQRCLALFYNDCRSGYGMDVCGICSYQGAWDTTRKTYDRGPGHNPDADAAFRQISDTARATYGAAVRGAEATYNLVKNQFENELKALVKQALTQAAYAYLDANKAFVVDLSQRLARLQADPEMANTVKRVLVAGARRAASPQNLADMQAIAAYLCLGPGRPAACPSLPAGMNPALTLAVFIATETSAGIGLNSAVGVMLTVEPATFGRTPPIPEVRAFIESGLMLGPDIVNSIDPGIEVQLGKPQSGNYVGVSANGHLGVGVLASVTFSLPSTLPQPDFSVDPTDPNALQYAIAKWVLSLTPGLSVGPGGGEGAGAAVEFGSQTVFPFK